MWTVLLREKSEAFSKFKTFKELAEQETRTMVNTIRSDRGGEFMSQEFDSFCNTHGINIHTTTPYSPQQNGVVERRNRTLMEMTRSLLKHMNIPNSFWREAVRHATYLINRVVTRSFQGQTPYEVLRSKKPNISHLRVFGCVCYARTETPGRKKLDDRSRSLIHLGTEPGSKAYRLVDPLSKKIVVSRDVHFDEDKQWNWDVMAGTKGTESDMLEVELLPWRDVDDDSDTQAASENEEEEEEVVSDEENGSTEEELQTGARRSNRVRTKPSYLDNYVLLSEVECGRLLMVINNEPWDYNEAKSLKVWVDACKEELNSTERNNTWVLVDLPKGFKPIGLKWVFKVKRNADGSISKYKAWLVAKGYVQ